MSIWSTQWGVTSHDGETIVEIATALSHHDRIRVCVYRSGQWGEEADLTPTQVESMIAALTTTLERVSQESASVSSAMSEPCMNDIHC